jgi:hypothetical protein
MGYVDKAVEIFFGRLVPGPDGATTAPILLSCEKTELFMGQA